MKYMFLLLVLLSAAAQARDFKSLRVTNLISDDEGTKVIAQSSEKKSVVLYLSQSNQKFEDLSSRLQNAKTSAQPVNIKTLDGGHLNTILDVETKNNAK